MFITETKTKRLKKALNTLIILLLVITTSSACMMERKLAKKAITVDDTINVCLISPYVVLKQNLKTWEIDGYDTIPKEITDSLLFYNSKFLRHVTDSAIITAYSGVIMDDLRKLHIRVYPQDSMSAFLAAPGRSYLFSIAQISLEEYMEPVRKTFALDTSTYWEIWCNAVNMNIWYEASVLNDSSNKLQVLFGNMFVRDNIKGRFTGDFYNGGVTYDYTIDSMSTSSVNKLAAKAGKTHATYIFDFIMNDQMALKAKTGKPPQEYMHFDPVKKTYKKAGTKRFTVVKQ